MKTVYMQLEGIYGLPLQTYVVSHIPDRDVLLTIKVLPDGVENAVVFPFSCIQDLIKMLEAYQLGPEEK